ncbi:MAG: Omp28-related outer membrane protein [Sphingobacteriales bacterium]|nr:MAG: Omp28-related outer membrane protein [Sphingobacteriales bacterium]
MYKKLSLLAGLAGIVLMTSCEEKGPIIELEPREPAEDTTYVGTVGTVQPKKILIEEFTGATCPNCPDAQVMLNNFSAQNPGRLAIMAVHVLNVSQTRPVKGAKYDFRTQDGTDAATTYYGAINNLPNAGIDRTKSLAGDMQQPTGAWGKSIEDRLKLSATVNLDVASTYNAQTRMATIEVKIAYNKAMEGQQFLSLALVEDGMIDKQDKTGVVVEDYVFNHVLRDYITSPVGVAYLGSTTKEAGRVYIRRFKYKVEDARVAEKCHLIAFVHSNNGENKEVLQAADAHLTGK